MLFLPVPIGKVCRKCGIWKPAHLMVAHKQCSDGIQRICKACKAEYFREWSPKNRDKLRKNYNRWRETNADLENERKRTRYHANPEKARERNKAQYRKDIEHSRALRRKINKKRDLAVMREQSRQFRKAHPEYVTEYTRNRRARRRKAGGTITRFEWQSLKARYGFTCLACGRKEPEIKLTLDHIVPLIRGGTHTIDNAQPLCYSCNSSKGTQTTDYRPE